MTVTVTVTVTYRRVTTDKWMDRVKAKVTRGNVIWPVAGLRAEVRCWSADLDIISVH